MSRPSRIAIGADHGGFELKTVLAAHLQAAGYQVSDVGTSSHEAVDYPVFARAVAEAVSSGAADVGIMIDGAGIGSCMAANKVPGVRAALAYDLSSARNSREHNDANVLTLGAGLIGGGLAKQIVDTWLATECTETRHGMIEQIRRTRKYVINATRAFLASPHLGVRVCVTVFSSSTRPHAHGHMPV